MPEHMHPTSTSRKVRMVCMTALLLAGSLSIWAEATASQAGATPATITASSIRAQADVAGTGQTAKPLGSMLNEDGTLNPRLRIQRQPRSFGLADGIFCGRASTLRTFRYQGTSQPQEKPNPTDPKLA